VRLIFFAPAEFSEIYKRGKLQWYNAKSLAQPGMGTGGERKGSILTEQRNRWGWNGLLKEAPGGEASSLLPKQEKI